MIKQKFIELVRVSPDLYPLPFSYDEVFQITNEDRIPIGVIFLTFLESDEIYIEWLELLTIFRGNGYLRKIFKTLKNKFNEKKIQFECSEELRFKYLRVGCEEHGISELTENYRMSY